MTNSISGQNGRRVVERNSTSIWNRDRLQGLRAPATPECAVHDDQIARDEAAALGKFARAKEQRALRIEHVLLVARPGLLGERLMDTDIRPKGRSQGPQIADHETGAEERQLLDFERSFSVGSSCPDARIADQSFDVARDPEKISLGHFFL